MSSSYTDGCGVVAVAEVDRAHYDPSTVPLVTASCVDQFMAWKTSQVVLSCDSREWVHAGKQDRDVELL